MQQFAAGFVVSLLFFLPIALWCFHRKFSKVKSRDDSHLKELEDLSKLISELAHEIKNPLSTIKINLKLIAEELNELALAADGRQNQGIGRMTRKIGLIQKEADRLVEILDSFIRYSDKSELQLAKIDVNELVGDMVDFYRPQSYSSSITIRQLLYSKPLICNVDSDMLKQVILNLFINAQRAINDGGEIMIRTDKQEKFAQIQISDTGSGISADKLANIFDAHHSVKLRRRGLGLPIARKIIEAHKGKLSVSSEPGRGTLFVISLPLFSGSGN